MTRSQRGPSASARTCHLTRGRRIRGSGLDDHPARETLRLTRRSLHYPTVTLRTGVDSPTVGGGCFHRGSLSCRSTSRVTAVAVDCRSPRGPTCGNRFQGERTSKYLSKRGINPSEISGNMRQSGTGRQDHSGGSPDVESACVDRSGGGSSGRIETGNSPLVSSKTTCEWG